LSELWRPANLFPRSCKAVAPARTWQRDAMARGAAADHDAQFFTGRSELFAFASGSRASAPKACPNAIEMDELRARRLRMVAIAFAWAMQQSRLGWAGQLPVVSAISAFFADTLGSITKHSRALADIQSGDQQPPAPGRYPAAAIQSRFMR